MTTHVEHGTIRSDGFSLFGNVNAEVRARYKAWRAERARHEQIEALRALGPDILDDIGVSLEKPRDPAHLIAVFNPYAIVVSALYASPPMERGES